MGHVAESLRSQKKQRSKALGQDVPNCLGQGAEAQSEAALAHLSSGIYAAEKEIIVKISCDPIKTIKITIDIATQ